MHFETPALTAALTFASSTSAQSVLASLSPCIPPLPVVLASYPPTVSTDGIANASSVLDDLVTAAFNANHTGTPNIDSLVLAVVTANGTVFEKGYGIRIANETDSSLQGGTPDKNTIYRVDSTSKLITAAETMYLKQQGLVSLDDPITKYFPNLTEIAQSNPSVDPSLWTLRSIMGHIAGLPANIPTNLTNWPQNTTTNSTAPTLAETTVDDLFNAIATTNQPLPMWSWPMYSNLDYALTGMVNMAVAKDPPATHLELLQRDLFGPLGMNSTALHPDDDQAKRFAVCSTDPSIADNLSPVGDPAGGLFTSLADMELMMQMMLDTSKNNSILTPATMREWLRPVSALWDDEFEMGLPWEIFKLRNTHGRVERLFTKSGSGDAYQASFAINPLSGGRFPAFDNLKDSISADLYQGDWTSSDGQTYINISLDDGALWAHQVILEGTDAVTLLLGAVAAGDKVTLWPTFRPGVEEFRISFGFSGQNGIPNWRCMVPVVDLDIGYNFGHPTTQLLFGNDPNGQRYLSVPATGAILYRS
ncbi:beta-lactamase/transpeptidase-like protein [Stereum hirsutum FP-91666 SS1]|uniref:beta-lactamase/transpeptidase-like protein n=1 Tax=Stereum hirsutum (strain FP-91666) TaxID=721885 RepID=UPI000440A7A8|nr:beta-lactamase/transpeptidase-like protein [Stereum hirsutum FP-91666 SS1]EIM90913.1 beta-lactamase/transpeptidase-like protein [Stereum hirsutum FP-91666 SS1]